MRYSILLVCLSFSILVSAGEMKDYKTDPNPSTLLDTIPIGGYMYDTIVTFDPDTYKSRTAIYKTKVEGYRYDTMAVFDPETYVETIYVEKIPYGSEKELVIPETGEDVIKAQIECVMLEWGPISHNYMYSRSNQITISPKQLDVMLSADMKWSNSEGCEENLPQGAPVMYVQYTDGNLHYIPNADVIGNRDKVAKSKMRKKNGTMVKLEGLMLGDEQDPIQLPPIFFTVQK